MPCVRCAAVSFGATRSTGPFAVVLGGLRRPHMFDGSVSRLYSSCAQMGLRERAEYGELSTIPRGTPLAKGRRAFRVLGALLMAGGVSLPLSMLVLSEYAPEKALALGLLPVSLATGSPAAISPAPPATTAAALVSPPTVTAAALVSPPVTTAAPVAPPAKTAAPVAPSAKTAAPSAKAAAPVAPSTTPVAALAAPPATTRPPPVSPEIAAPPVRRSAPTRSTTPRPAAYKGEAGRGASSGEARGEASGPRGEVSGPRGEASSAGASSSRPRLLIEEPPRIKVLE